MSRSTIRSSGRPSMRWRRPTSWPCAIPRLATAASPLTGDRVNRFLHIARSPEDLVMQNKMQRRLGQLTGTCFQRCVGMDALNSLHSVTYEMDEKHGTRVPPALHRLRRHGAAGQLRDRRRHDRREGRPQQGAHEQADPDLFVHVASRTDKGITIKGAKAHQTGCMNSHWLIVMPTMRLGPGRQGLRDRRRAARRRARHHLHLRPPVL